MEPKAETNHNRKLIKESGYYLRLENDQTRTGFQSQNGMQSPSSTKARATPKAVVFRLLQIYCFLKKGTKSVFSENHYLAIK